MRLRKASALTVNTGAYSGPVYLRKLMNKAFLAFHPAGLLRPQCSDPLSLFERFLRMPDAFNQYRQGGSKINTVIARAFGKKGDAQKRCKNFLTPR
jgi:hypothetical protein